MKDYLPRDMVFDRPCVEWVWENYHMLSSGIWPGSDPSGYTDVPGHIKHGTHAPFETPVLVAAEVAIRVKRCGLDSYLVEEKYIGLKSEEEIAKDRHLSFDDVCRRINKALWYCSSGRTPRWISTRKHQGQTYEEWKQQARFKRIIRG